MALFKPFRGSRAALEAQEKHDGYAYFCTDDGTFHIDYVDSDGNLQRKQINKFAGKTTFIELLADNWLGEEGLYAQIIEIPNITINSKIDLQPAFDQTLDLLNQGVQMQAINEDGTCIVIATGEKPTTDYNMQVLITETAVV